MSTFLKYSVDPNSVDWFIFRSSFLQVSQRVDLPQWHFQCYELFTGLNGYISELLKLCLQFFLFILCDVSHFYCWFTLNGYVNVIWELRICWQSFCYFAYYSFLYLRIFSNFTGFEPNIWNLKFSLKVTKYSGFTFLVIKIWDYKLKFISLWILGTSLTGGGRVVITHGHRRREGGSPRLPEPSNNCDEGVNWGKSA